METTKATITILNDLIEINNDRIKGYEKAIGELKDGDQDLKALFSGMIDESREARNALGVEVQVLGADMEPADSTTNSGKIYKAWMSKLYLRGISGILYYPMANLAKLLRKKLIKLLGKMSICLHISGR
jgi:hypothetical protein